DDSTINLTVKISKNKDLCFPNQRIGSLEEIKGLIRGLELLRENTILQGDDGQVMNTQHLESARSTGSLNITLANQYIDTGLQILEKAFNCQFQDPNNMKERFLKYLNKKYMTWKSDTNHRVPYSTIFQSSGYGKSRLVKEVAKDIPTIYLCLRDVRSTGYPLRTSLGADLFERVLENLKEGEEWRFLYILQLAIQCFKEELAKCDNNCEKLWNSQMDTAFCERVWVNIQHKSENWRSICNDEVNNSADFIFDKDSSKVSFILCIDEARTLIPSASKTSPFRLLRRALRKIKWNGFFVLLLDTLSKISNFAPPKSIDPSSRDTSDLPLKLFYPYFRLTTMDVFESNTYKDESWNLAKFGRPLYISYLQSCDDDPEAIDKLKNLLERKLLGGANNFEESQQDISSLAILSSIIGLDMSPQSQLASELVASHMTTCVSVSEDRERLIIAFPSEPLLSDVALNFISDSILSKILKQFNALLKKGLVEPGPRGEIVSRIILAIVAYKLKTGTDNSVQKFLEELYHEDSMLDLDGFSDEFTNGTVSFTHFNAIEYVPAKKDLKRFYSRRCAFIMKRNHPGADICIPVKLATDTDKYSLIIIQIKNIDTTSITSDKKYPASANSMLDCSYVFEKSDLKDHHEPCLCLYWQLGYSYHYQEDPNESTVKT
ncbi:1713_t:CDS:1, partial [Funneliformis geosporum]